ncbi:MAG: hypothetical protein GTN80_04135 [Nitrososphaeria archaeon]|nr:hypothetical protein [Nitrososphaeria archaeon]NIN52340.1 hypothetical protein [Nitrososphaeria archaeon]NIQ32818.1 hypothetical protein [Nitrososphaeria archaeon]
MNLKLLIPILALLAFLGALLYSTNKLIPIYASTSGPFNPGWNGTSLFYSLLERKGYEVTSLEYFSDLEKMNDKVLLISVGPDSGYTEIEVEEIARRLSMGDLSLLVADEGGAGSILNRLVGVKVGKGLIVDLIKNPERPEYPIVTCEIGDEKYAVILNYASWIETYSRGHGNFTLLRPTCRGSLLSWGDSSGDLVRNPDEWASSGAVVALLGELESGSRIAVLMDSSVFINGMLNLADNLNFSLSLVNWLSDGERPLVAFDNSHYNMSCIPLPGMGNIMLLVLTNAQSISSGLAEKIASTPLYLQLLPLLVTALILGYTLTTWYGTKGSGSDTPPPTAWRVKSAPLEVDYIRSFNILCKAVSDVMERRYNCSLDELISDPNLLGRIESATDSSKKRFLKAMDELRSMDHLRWRWRLSAFLWRKKVRRLIEEVDAFMREIGE